MSNTIRIIGLGASDLAQLPLGLYRKLQAADTVYVRTEDHPVIAELIQEGCRFKSFDDVYEAHDRFEDVYEEIVDKLLQEVEKNSELVYAVPGHPMVAETTVQLLLKQKEEVNIIIEGGQSFLDDMFSSLRIDPIEGFQLIDGTSMRSAELSLKQHIIIGQVFDQMSASAVKLSLMERFPDDYAVTVVTAAGSTKETKITVPLFELDRVTTISNLTAVYVPPVGTEQLLYRDFSKLRDVIKLLRSPNGCPWDQKQTHQSLKRYLIEEAYELLEAIDEDDDEHLIEELGDVLLQVLLHAQIGEDEGFFNMEDVIETLTEKMIRRHPHVFADVVADNPEEVLSNWEEIKKQEKANKETTNSTSLLDGIPISLPSLLRSYKLQKKAAKVGFDWGEEAPMWMKLQEEMAEWLYEIKKGSEQRSVEELGDVLFAFVNLARYHHIDPEEALQKTNAKFARRFNYIEQEILKRGEDLEKQTLAKLDELWEKSKKMEL